MSAAAQARKSKLHGTRACSRLTVCAVRHTGNVCHQPWAAKSAGVTVNHHSRSSRAAVRHPQHQTNQQVAKMQGMIGEQRSCRAAHEANGQCCIRETGRSDSHRNEGGGAQDSRARRTHDAVHLSAAETPEITDAPLARHHRHAVSLLGPCRGDRSCASVFSWRKVTISA